MAPAFSVVIVCHDSAGDLPATLAALLPQLEDDDELVLVDNASGDGTPDLARRLAPAATVLETGANLGFAGGVNAGVGASSAPLVLLLNPDAVPAEGCLAALRGAAAQQPDWGAWQALVTMDGGTAVNSAGNVVHFLGFGWAGRCGEPLAAVAGGPQTCAFGSGAALAVRRDAFDAVGRFDDRYFMYGEDLDLSLRLRLAGWRIGLVRGARVEHGYEFVKGDYKWFLLERNRWWTLIGDYPLSLLVLLAPALLAFELALLPAAWRGGWLRAKLRAQAAVVRELPAMWARRRPIQRARRLSPRAFAEGLEPGLDSPYLAAAARLPGVEAGLRAYWRCVLALLR